MSPARVGGSRRRLTSGRRALLVGGVALLVGLAGTSLVLRMRQGAADVRRERRAVQQYLAALQPLAREGGRIVQQGLKAGISDIPAGRFSDEVLRRMTQSWGRELAAVRDRVAALHAPVHLREAHERFLEALDGYVRVAALLETAVRAPMQERGIAVQPAVTAGEAADRIWDRGAAVVQGRLRRLGLQPVSWFPSPGP